ncbi:hypothetical protein H0H92_008317 [Tricholoma furcatifolium]|nr:hypothetical protein H0H92_008317 [Tricholoma furcatifolium]
MSGSYRLETPRPRQPPPAPLRFTEPSFTSSSVLNSQGSQTLLYDLPSTSSMSPPPTSPQRLISPTSPTFPARTRRGAPTPPPSGRNRSSTPSAVAPNELETFAVHCRAWYFNQDEESGRQMTQTMSTLPPSQRAPFARLQATIRADYHRSVNVRKNAEFQAHLTAMQPGGSLNAHSRADPQGALAKKVMRLQVIPENLGGAGGYRIEWGFDDAVFKEAAGREFMFEAIDVLKGVLAFEEILSSKRSSHSIGLYPDPEAAHSRSQSSPLPSDRKPLKISSTVQPKRARAPSDPFLDTPTPALPRSAPSASSHSPPNTTAALLGRSIDGIEERPSLEDTVTPLNKADTFDEGDEDYMRIWTSPDLSNPELLELLKLFPSFVSRRPLPRFARPDPRHPDIEEGEDEDVEGKRIHFGTGSIWISAKPRNDDWNGGWWTRFILWWRRMFC